MYKFCILTILSSANKEDKILTLDSKKDVQTMWFLLRCLLVQLLDTAAHNLVFSFLLHKVYYTAGQTQACSVFAIFKVLLS